ncbi:MAG: (2Fe-2S)-binding protein [Desulfobacterales bacterium]|jgi:predicted molibdopterin-dependent oxidoreductase YjgC|nr:(2Fe-2S)-binding protein [Desulfobacterales bacterium]MDP6808465.1 (2Fe-2S)-binding protein [Desulfobacterales bacterium]|tara:strand:+ start:2013 stop:2330 length:318 start_codon:yes stop_codon:yes gene_type:complete
MNTSNSKFTWNNPPEASTTVTINFEGETRIVPAGVTVAAALLGHDDEHVCRSAADQEKRSPYCLMGVCFECLVEIDGLQNRQACLEPVFDGMSVKRQDKVVNEKK